MEQLVETIENEQQAIIQRTGSSVTISKKSLLVMYGIMAVLLIGSLGLTCFSYFNLSKNQLSLEQELNKTKQSLANVDARNQKDSSDMDALFETTNFLTFEHKVEGGIVTDDFFVDKAYFEYDLKQSKITGIIDLNNQPSMSLKYKGQGSFDLPDRELKGKMQDIAQQIQQAYNTYFKDTKYASVKDTEYTFSVKNYEVGTYSNGQFKLKGE